MNREEIAGYLKKLRDGRLREEVDKLQRTANVRHSVKRTHADVLATARGSGATDFRELAALGEMRLDCIKRDRELGRQLIIHSEQVIKAHKLAEGARLAVAQFVRARLAAQERSREHDAEHFLTWKRNHRG